MINRARVAFVVALTCASGIVRADSWVPPSVRVEASESGEYLVRMEPGRRGQQGSRAVIYRHDTAADSYQKRLVYALPHPVSPVDILLTDDGMLVTLDEWAQMGRGTVITVHGADGKTTHRYTLPKLLGDKAAAAAPSTVSSTWWRCGKPSLIGGGHVLRVITYDEGELRVDLRDGTVDHEPGNGRCQ
ncbi:hypothetical protein [Pseudoxanthomonas sp. Root65]|uniref:hypothetical protein n=1 Tax=Pseudoxanthomonas sp. Root65 TaxID=1736576 RepID=UPI000A51314D|nr:hypothetical protein [Pseudoxanthomonas sp. Root65]